MKCGHFEDRAGLVAPGIDPKRIELSRNGPQVGWHCSPHNWSTFQTRQKQQVVILNDFHVDVFSRNAEVCRTGSSLDAGAGKCLQFNVCIIGTFLIAFYEKIIQGGQEVITMSKQLERHFDRSFCETWPWLLERWTALFVGWIAVQRISPNKTNWVMHDIDLTAC